MMSDLGEGRMSDVLKKKLRFYILSGPISFFNDESQAEMWFYTTIIVLTQLWF